jgi:hypothetical protein
VQRVQRALLAPVQESQLPLEVTALYVAMPLMLTLDCDAAVFAITTAVELGPEVGRCDARRWYTRQGRRACNRWLVGSWWFVSNRRRSRGHQCAGHSRRARVCS